MDEQQQIIKSNMAALKSRYDKIMPFAEQLEEVLYLPLPRTCWLNSLRCGVDESGSLFNPGNAMRLPWCENGFRVNVDYPLGKSWLYRCGLLQVQEEVSMLPVFALDPKPGDVVLDMCAAPGNKTAQIAVAMQNQGTVVANDIHYQRLRALGQITQRLGLMNVNFHVGDGTSLSCREAVFDKILVDAPCSCEGTLRKGKCRVIVPRQAQSVHLANTQIALLKKAIQLLKPGGRLVYSTCTFAPEENECVVDTILKQHAGVVSLRDIGIPHFVAEPGLTAWQGRSLSPDLRRTWRIWPHLNNTGGFYMAVFEKEGEAPSLTEERPRVCRFKRSEAVDQTVLAVAARFGIDVKQSGVFEYYQPSQRGIFASGAGNMALYENGLRAFDFDSVGLFFIKTKIRFPKFSSSASLVMGRYATKCVVELLDHQLADYLNRVDIELAPGQRMACKGTGYVIVKYKNNVIGQGLLFEREKQQHWPLRSLFPGYW